MSASTAAGLAALIAVLGASPAALADPWSDPWSDEESTLASRLGDGNRGRLYRPPILRLEAVVLGGSLVLEQGDVIDDSLGSFASDGRAEARGGLGRLLVGYGTLYAGIDMGAVGWRGGPAVRSSVEPTTFESASEASSSAGTMLLGSFFVGTQHTIGRLIIGGELGVGVNLGWTDARPLETSVPVVSFARAALPVRARAGVWLTRHVSLVGTLGTDLANRGGHEIGVAIGLSSGAWDGQR